MVDPHGMVAHVPADAVERVADNRGGQVPDVQRFCNVHGRIVNADVSARALAASAVAGALGVNAREHGPGLRAAVQRKVQVSARGLRAADPLGQRNAFGKLLRNQRRRLAQGLCKAEAGKRKVAQLRVGRRFQQSRDLLCGQAGFFCDRLCDHAAKLHGYPLSVSFRSKALL